MQSYEEFCQRSLARLQAEGQAMRTVPVPHPSQGPHSAIRFHGRAVLPPLLCEEQRREMADHRQKAIQLEVDRQTLKRSNLLIRVQNILDRVKEHKVPDVERKPLPETPQLSPAPKPETVNGYTLITDPPEFPRGAGARAGGSERPITPHPEHPAPHLNGYGGEIEKGRRDELDGSLESLLRRSREYVEKEKGLKVTTRMAQTPPQRPPPESLSDKESDGRSQLGETAVNRESIQSPLSPYQTQNQTQNMSPHQTQTRTQYQAGCDSYDRQSSCLSPSPSDLFASLPSPEPSLSPRPHRRRPRPISTGNIHISFPIGPADLIPRGLGRSGEGGAMAAWEEASAGGLRLPDHWGLLGSSGGSGNSSRRSSHCATSPARETSSPINAHTPGTLAQDILSSGFRRRCHTLDSQLHSSSPPPPPALDRSQERLPRFMGGVPRLAPNRRPTTAPLNQSYEVENPTPSLPRPHITADLHLGHGGRTRLEAEGTKGPQDGRQTPVALSHTLEEQDKTEETQRCMQALEDMQRRLEEEHVLQMSLLIAEQEKEQQRLHQELEGKERSLRQQVCDRRPLIDSYPAVSPVCPSLSPAQSPADRSPGHSMGFPSPLSSGVSSPCLQTPVYVWGPTWGGSKSRGRLSQALTSGQQRALIRLAAITRGFLTRRLLRTEKVKHLRQTVQDTQEFIRSFQTEPSQKRGPITPQDLSLQERVRAQLRAARYDVHDIFFEMPLQERLALLQQDRELRAERRLREMEKAKSPKERMTLSAATQRSLDRKKSSSRVGESPGPARKLHQKPKSPPANRILKPSQGQNAPVPGQLNRQGSWYRKTPEERVRRSDSMKKQHSLG